MKKILSFNNANKTTGYSLKETVLNNTVFAKYDWMRPTYTAKTKYVSYPKYISTDDFFDTLHLQNKYLLPELPVTYTAVKSNGFFSNVMKKFNEYWYYSNNPTYDFKIGNTPVQVHGNYWIVGNTVVPMNADDTFFSKLSGKTKETVINVFIILNRTEDYSVFVA